MTRIQNNNMEGQYAGFVTRFIAWLIDLGVTTLIIAAAIWLINLVAGIFGIDIYACSVPSSGLDLTSYICFGTLIFTIIFTLAFTPLYLMIFWTLTGQTLGKAFVGVRVVKMDGNRMTFGISFRRYLGYILSFPAFGFGFLWILFDNRRRGFADILANTCVIYSWKARQNEGLINDLTQKLFRRRQQLDELSERVEAVKEAAHGKDVSPTNPDIDPQDEMKI